MNFRLLIIILFFILIGCKQNYTPKPRGFFRINFPEKNYHPLNNGFPYQFEIPDYAKITADSRNPDQPFWINITIPESKAEMHISYYNLQKRSDSGALFLGSFIEETRRLAYQHSIKADAIEEQIFMNQGRKVFGTIYRIEGNAASPMQFFLTDSTNHFLRGALYIREVPNIDSLKPVIDFLEPDVIRLIETTSWN
ncbi:MAG: gliding motility lipoprotein GldD [Prolixibacteraceae bacterium]|jgi:gliding motility-associated lipoprotein GldD|nr:gliding motility lipoprotein GldD [Prolixibacteraceae bacterium]MBT6006024.1 gliding motility lipoprotein GldD [Prolixibacteraceae bacterium]MBT6766553.1 gliding motility lipoprotein GldD [Prolixibacteraceae bacterium]MBT6997367.1 gliding motility lipoprotein GldD [Prolixibacteraceae bacterium]MBT7394405.1 gliding motility lipoprotein GldD [Prolixibacteraceae bacterium]